MANIIETLLLFMEMAWWSKEGRCVMWSSSGGWGNVSSSAWKPAMVQRDTPSTNTTLHHLEIQKAKVVT